MAAWDNTPAVLTNDDCSCANTVRYLADVFV
jgi:hypothetical protein